MKDKWNAYWKLLEATKTELDEFLENGGLSTLAATKSKKLCEAFTKMTRSASELDQYISPVAELEVKIPYESDEFRVMWQRWKDYLTEQFGQLMRSRAEVSALEYLEKISKADEAKAIYMLRYAMANRYRNFFEIDEKDSKKPAAQDFTGSSY